MQISIYLYYEQWAQIILPMLLHIYMRHSLKRSCTSSRCKMLQNSVLCLNFTADMFIHSMRENEEAEAESSFIDIRI